MKKILFILLFVSSFAKAQDRYIVLTEQQKSFFNNHRTAVIDSLLNYYHADFEPISIRNNLYVIPIAVIQAIPFMPIKRRLIEANLYDKLTIRIVQPEEFWQYDLNGNRY